MQSLKPWLLRGLVVLALVSIAALLVMVRPLQEAPHPTATPTRKSRETPTLEQPTLIPSRTPLPTATPMPTLTPSPTPTITPSPAPTAVATEATTTTASIITAPIMHPDAKLAGRVEQHTYHSTVTNREEPYRIYLPPGYDSSDQSYPVLYLIHGLPYDESHWDNLGADDIADANIQAGGLPPFIIVMPGAAPDSIFVTTAGGEHSLEGQIVIDLIPHVDATYRTQTVREGRAIGGISRGGVWSLEIGLRHADMFAAVGGHSPALKYNLAPQMYDPFYLLEEPGVSDLRIYLDAGDTDWALQDTQRLHEAISAKGIPSQFVVHPGGHSDGLWGVHMGEYLAFYAAGW